MKLKREEKALAQHQSARNLESGYEQRAKRKRQIR
jgi:hypothetical protein